MKHKEVSMKDKISIIDLGYTGLSLVHAFIENTIEIGSGFSPEERKKPPIIGSLITFKFKEFTKYGNPGLTAYLRVREE